MRGVGDFDDKVVVVTGAGSGLGRASAMGFASAGASVVVADVDEETGTATARAIEAADGDAHFLRTDVSDEDSVRRMVEATLDRYGRLDCAHNNAGVSPWTGDTTQTTRADWDVILGVNLTGVWQCMKHEIPAMREAGGGAIVNTSSGSGLIGVANQPAYVASKWGVVGLTRAAALEFAADDIRINCICPGAMLTPLTKQKFGLMYGEEDLRNASPMKRFGEVEEVAAAAIWLCSDAASFVDGAALPVDGASSA